MSHQTISKIMFEICTKLWKKLAPIHLRRVTSKEEYARIEEGFFALWNFPNCLGAIDGKHIRVRAPRSSGSVYHNYKGYFSIVLQGTCDAYHRFTDVSIGAEGSMSDGGVFKDSSLGTALLSGAFPHPPPSRLPNSDLICPHYFLGDNAYPLKTWMLAPYSNRRRPTGSLEETRKRHNFNYRHSRARRSIESTFGILSAKFRCLRTMLEIEPKKVDLIVLTCCLLHNIIINLEGTRYSSKEIDDFEEDYRKSQQQTHPNQPQHGNISNRAKQLRENIKEYLYTNGKLIFEN